MIKIFDETAGKVARMLLQIQAIKLNAEKPFSWSSGWKSPIYCDNRLSLSFPEIRDEIKKGLVSATRLHFQGAEAIAGVATAGIAQGALVADEMKLPFLYVRPKPKEHGMENLIEGKVTKGQKVVVVEDLVSTGGSSLKSVFALRDAGFEVLGMICIFNYGFDIAEKNFQDARVSLVSLSDYNNMLKVAVVERYISEEDMVSLKAWRVDPADWKRNR